MGFCPPRTKTSEKEKDEDSGNGFVGAGGDRAGERAGAGRAYHVSIGATAECGWRGSERRFCCGVESCDGGIGRRGGWGRCGWGPGRGNGLGRGVGKWKGRGGARQR